MNTSFGAVIASKKRRKIIRAFKKANAVSADSAKSLQEIGLSRSVMFNIQKHHGVIIETLPDIFYLDKSREKELKRKRIYFAIAISIIVTIFILLFYST